MGTHFLGNASKMKFVIPNNILMAGYSDRVNGNSGTHDSLYTSAVAISDGHKKVVLITNDLLCVDKEIVSFVTEGIKERHDLPEENIFVCASHTHSGPSICQWEVSKNGKELTKDVRILKDEIESIILQNALKALDKLKPVKISFGYSNNTIVGNNRIAKESLSDGSVNVIKLLANDGKILSLIVNYACHPTILGSDNMYISADYPGVLNRRLGEKFKDSVALFINGACGDQSTRYTRRAQDFDEVERMGGYLYDNVISALDNVKPVEGSINGLKKLYNFPVKILGKYDEALKIYEDAKRIKESIFKADNSPAIRRQAITRYQGAVIMLQLYEYMKRGIKLEEYIQLLKIGDLLIVGLPVELFVEYGLKIKKNSLFSKTVVACYTNNMLGYVYTPNSLDDRDYEALSSPFAVGTGEYIVNLIQDLIVSIKN